ncbi:YciI family protein [Paenibacillus alkalitolerans]|uniref:YciI family protein n=1 Tax=Paenibacillus alkalitolerans TaxID=2799335 RepID=UPI0018F75027|nr:YciI family protein [Paenibacillus alkalitolerans]
MIIDRIEEPVVKEIFIECRPETLFPFLTDPEKMVQTKDDFEARTDEMRKESYWPAWKAFTQSMREAGILANPGNILHPGNTAYSVKCANGQVHASEGSHTDGSEQLSGYYVIDVRDADEAIEWASALRQP